VTWRGQEGLQALLSRRYWAGVHGDVLLPRIDVRRSWRSGLADVAGGSSGGRGGVVRVTTMAATAAAVLASVTTAIAAVVLVSVVGYCWVVLGGQDDMEGCGLGAGGAMLV
jgi:hypothetical protein